jgi:hypothetical protein
MTLLSRTKLSDSLASLRPDERGYPSQFKLLLAIDALEQLLSTSLLSNNVLLQILVLEKQQLLGSIGEGGRNERV